MNKSEYFVKYRIGKWLVGNTETKIVKANSGKEVIKIAKQKNNDENLFDWQYTFEILDVKKL